MECGVWKKGKRSCILESLRARSWILGLWAALGDKDKLLGGRCSQVNQSLPLSFNNFNHNT